MMKNINKAVNIYLRFMDLCTIYQLDLAQWLWDGVLPSPPRFYSHKWHDELIMSIFLYCPQTLLSTWPCDLCSSMDTILILSSSRSLHFKKFMMPICKSIDHLHHLLLNFAVMEIDNDGDKAQ